MNKQISFCLKMTVTSCIVLAVVLFISTQRVSSSSDVQKNLVLFTVGSNGTIMKTRLGESGWKAQTSITDNTLLSADFIDDNVGWLVGSRGTILHTIDGGLTWANQTSGTTVDLQSVEFVDETKGWAVGGLIDGTILATRNAGSVWELQTSLPERLNAVHFTDEENGWVVGASGAIYHTSNSGMDWSRQDIGTDSNLTDVDFINDHKGWIITNNAIYFTNNKGLSWQLQASFNSFKENLYALEFIDEKYGWVVGVNGTIIHTRDGGLHWSKQYSRTNISFLDVAFINADVGWVVGAFGIIHYTDDGGQHWSKQNSNTPVTLHKIVIVKKSKSRMMSLDVDEKHELSGTDEEENISRHTEGGSLITIKADAFKIVPNKELTTYVNIRQIPSSDGALIGELRPGEQLDYVKSFNYWHEVKLNNGSPGYVSKNWTKIVSASPGESAEEARVSTLIQLQTTKVSSDSSIYSVQVGSWKNKNYAKEMLEKIKKYYPDAYLMVHNNYNKIRLPRMLTKKQGVDVSMDIEEKFNIRPLLVLRAE